MKKWMIFSAFLALMTVSVSATAQVVLPTTFPVILENASNCDYEVKINLVPTTGCTVMGTGPLRIVPAGTTIVVNVPNFIGGVAQHVPAFGVQQLNFGRPCPPILVGDACSPYPGMICNYCTCDPCVQYNGPPTNPRLRIF